MNIETKFWLITLSIIIFIIAGWLPFHLNRLNPPSLYERIIAKGWLLFRRVVCFSGALSFLFGAIIYAFNLFEKATQMGTLDRIGATLLMLLFSAISIWSGVYGQGPNEYQWKDDVKLHRKNKKRYGWRW